jgi:hypothetical protein
MALGSTQPLTEMATTPLLGSKGWPWLKAKNLTSICEAIVYKIWESLRLTTLWAFAACYRDSGSINSAFCWKSKIYYPAQKIFIVYHFIVNVFLFN